MYGGTDVYSCSCIIPYVLVCAVYLHIECSRLCMYACISVLASPFKQVRPPSSIEFWLKLFFFK